jgi:hypothetical protein
VIPDPVALDANEFDAETMRADYRANHRIARPGFAVCGVGFLILALLAWARHWPLSQYWWQLFFGVGYIAMSLWAGKGFPAAVLPSGMRFSATGLDFDVPFMKNPRRHYSWRGMRIDDIGEVFVLVPFFGARVVIPKRSFPDGGHEAWAFFTANHVARRTPLALA